MSTIFALLGPKVIGSLLAAVAAIIGLLGYGMKKKREGAQQERAKQAAAEAKARDVADEIQNDVGALPGSEAREELGKWSPDR